MSFWCLQFFQKTNKNNSTWGTVKLIFFIHFLGELKIPKRHFKINWPLVNVKYEFRIFFKFCGILRKPRLYVTECFIQYFIHIIFLNCVADFLIYCFTLIFKCSLLCLSWELRLKSIGYVELGFLHLCKFTRFFANFSLWNVESFSWNEGAYGSKCKLKILSPFVDYDQKGILSFI